MSLSRRLSAAVTAAALGWTGLALAPGAADAAAPVTSSVVVGRDAPHDPATYYAGTEGLTGTALALQLNSIIDGNTFIPYTSSSTDVWDALKVLDVDPNDPTKIIDAYSGDSLDITNQCGSSCALNGWNREHTWAQSRGSFDTSNGPGTDLFHMRPLRGNTNSSRGNKDFDNGGSNTVPGCPICKADGDSFEPRDGFKGDLARGLFYMDVRYNGDADDAYGVDLRMWDTVGNSGSQIGKLSTLVAWSLADPPDAGEKNRNDLVDGNYQHNRNPFIDHPEWVCAIWGSQVPAALCANNNHAPTTAPMTKTIAEDSGPTTVALTANDVDGDTLSWSITGQPTHGTANITTPGGVWTLNYTPAANYAGQDVVGVTVSDGKGGTAATTVTITVTPVNDAPVATAQIVATPQDTAKVVTLAGTDVDGDTLTFAIGNQPSHGTVDLAGNQATYTPVGGYHGPDSFTFTANDGNLSSAPATVSVNVTANNNAPVATAQGVSTAEDTAKVITLAGTDADGDTLTYAIAGQPSHGTVTRTGNQATYTPAANYTGPDSFTFTVNDGSVSSAPATVSVTVTAVNDAPVATAQGVSTAEDTAKVVTLAGTDVDGDTLTFAIASQPSHGTVTRAGNEATYTPAANYTGPDSFTFTVNDGSVTSAPATVSVTVTAVNDAPVATDKDVITAEDTAKVITLAGTDPDQDDELTFAIAGQPSHGTVSLVDNEATYTPAADYRGPDSFTFTVNDGTVSSAPGTVTLTVTSVNDAPTATATSATTDEDTAKVINLAGTDVDGDTLAFAKATGPAHGTVTITAAGQATYTPAANYHGPDSFTFTVNDGIVDSAPATVTITVTGVNDAPTATGASATTDEDTAKVIDLAGTDADGDTLTFAKASDPSHGTVSITAAGQATYTPTADYHGPDSFTFTVNDGTVTSAPATVTITVDPVDDTPVVTLVTPAATRGKPVTTTVTVTGQSGQPTPSGQVTITNGATTLGTVTLGVGGTATLTWTPTLAGTAHLVATYAGDALFGPATSAATPVPVARSASVLRFSGKVKKGLPAKIKVAITSVGGNAATGKVTVKVGTKKYTATLKNGVAKFKLPATTSAKLKVKATYAGDSQYAGGSGKHTYRVVTG